MIKFKKIFIAVFIIAVIITINDAYAGQRLKLFTNGSIYIDSQRRVDNLLIKDDTVQAYNVDASKFKNIEIIDLKGAALYPGFNDSHVHLVETGIFFLKGVDLGKASDAASIASMLAEKSRKLPEGEMILGVGFSLRNYDEWTLEDLAKIDAATPGRPAFLGDKLGHNCILNTMAMKQCGLDAGVKAPMGGKIIMQNGKLTGMFRESAMTLAGNKLFEKFDKGHLREGIIMMMNHWAALGYSAVVDLMGSAAGRCPGVEILRQLEIEGKLPVRVNFCYTFFNLDEIDGAVKYKGCDTPLVRFNGCKIFIDGAFAAGQAWTSWKNKQGNNGLYYVSTDDSYGREFNLNRIVARLEELGLNCHYHIQGDQGIENLLDALDKAAALNGGSLKCKHTIIHLAFPTHEQMLRIKNFGGRVVTTTQPGFWEVEDDTDYYYGERAALAYPIKELIDSGVSVGISTDFSVSPLDYAPPTVIMRSSATGGGPAGRHKPVSVKEIVHGFTAASAATTPYDDTGKLYAGYKADMVVYKCDLYTTPIEKFDKSNPEVLSTWVGGRKVYEASDNTANIKK